jgi:EmrB/QacA subfamily drug resistance transporter
MTQTITTETPTGTTTLARVTLWVTLALVLLADALDLIDSTVTNIAAPTIAHDLGGGAGLIKWLGASYTLALGALLVVGGRLGDRFGQRRLFLVGIAGFTLASLACGLAWSPAALIVSRVVQGCGSALMVPQVLALITSLFPPEERHRALAWFGVTVGLGAIAGQVLGGALVQVDLFGWGWRTIFFVNVPIGLVTVFLAARLLPGNRSAAKPQLDLAGVLAVTLSLGLALVPLTIGRSEGWPWWLVAPLCVSPVAFFLAARYEASLARRGGQPVLDLGLFKARSFSAGIAVNIGVFAYFGSILLGLTLFLQLGLGLSALDAGLSFAPLGVGFAATSLLARSLIGKHGSRVVTWGLVVALAALSAQLLDIHFSGTATDAARIAPLFLLIGAGNGLVIPALIGSSLTDVQPHKAGAASGLLATGQQFATAAGVAVLSEIFFAGLGSDPGKHGYVRAIQHVLLLDVSLLVLCFVASLFMPRPRVAPAPEVLDVEIAAALE